MECDENSLGAVSNLQCSGQQPQAVYRDTRDDGGSKVEQPSSGRHFSLSDVLSQQHDKDHHPELEVHHSGHTPPIDKPQRYRISFTYRTGGSSRRTESQRNVGDEQVHGVRHNETRGF